MTGGDRKKLAREMRVVLGLSESSYNPSPQDCADIAIAYADRRVAEALEHRKNEQIAIERERCAKLAWGNGNRHLARLIRATPVALSPAREGGTGDE